MRLFATILGSTLVSLCLHACELDLVVGEQASSPCVPTQEVCEDGRDNDCDGRIDEPECAVCLGAVEVCNWQDDDCDGLVDELGVCEGSPCGCRWRVAAEAPVQVIDPSDGSRHAIGDRTGTQVVWGNRGAEEAYFLYSRSVEDAGTFVQRADLTGAPQGTETRLHTEGDWPVAVVSDGDRVLLLWSGSRAGAPSGFTPWAAILDSTGAVEVPARALGGELADRRPLAAGLMDGVLYVVWNAEERAQVGRFDWATLEPVGSPSNLEDRYVGAVNIVGLDDGLAITGLRGRDPSVAWLVVLRDESLLIEAPVLDPPTAGPLFSHQEATFASRGQELLICATGSAVEPPWCFHPLPGNGNCSTAGYRAPFELYCRTGHLDEGLVLDPPVLVYRSDLAIRTHVTTPSDCGYEIVVTERLGPGGPSIRITSHRISPPIVGAASHTAYRADEVPGNNWDVRRLAPDRAVAVFGDSLVDLRCDVPPPTDPPPSCEQVSERAVERACACPGRDHCGLRFFSGLDTAIPEHRASDVLCDVVRDTGACLQALETAECSETRTFGPFLAVPLECSF